MIKSRYNAVRNTDVSVEKKLTTVLSDNFEVQCMSFYEHMME
jgi:hypothetical protein